MTKDDDEKTAQELRYAVHGKRRAAHREEGVLAATFREAMRLSDIQQADGVSVRDRLAGLEQSLRAAWPQGREWKYLCSRCDDYGLVMATCDGDATCGRHAPHLPHDFGTPCWCDKGARFRMKPKPDPSDYTAAGKSKPSRLGR